jgi:DNA polymerase I
MLLNITDFQLKAQEIAELSEGEIGFDFETTGLNPFKGDRAFLLGFTDAQGNKFSVKCAGHQVEDELVFLRAMSLFFSNRRIRYCAHNAKFELGFLLAQFGTEVKGEVWDTEVMARIEKNNHLSYSLQACAERISESKYPPMLAWLKQRGNKNAYHKAPDDLIIPYCEHDAWLSWRLRRHQVELFTHWDTSSPFKIKPVVGLEKAVLPHLFEMEAQGLLVDVGYCKRAVEYEKQQIENAKRDFNTHASVEFVDSRKTLKPVFDAHGICYGATALGNASFTEEALSGSRNHPVVAAILGHRRAVKRLSAYWENFLELEHNGIIHPAIHQNKAQTGRMSISDPSCQNWSTDEDEGTPFPIRRAFVARPDCVIVSCDYSQMELRKGADEAEDTPMIERVQSGADLHQEVADMAGVPRSLAKNGRFAKQYGAGIPRIAQTLGVSEAVAKTISSAIDQQAKAMAAYSRMLSRTCKPFGTDWLGRRFYFDPGFEYKAFNYRIQGGCSEILKIAICDVGNFLKKHARPETFILLPVHDELVFNMHEKDLPLLSEIKRLMIAAHRDKKVLAMDVGIEVGPNFHDLAKWTTL